MPSLLDRCPECGSPGPTGELCSTPDCRQRGVRIAPAKSDPSGPDGIVFDLGSLQAQFADIPDPEDTPMAPDQAPPPPPPPQRKPPGGAPAAPPAPPAAPPRAPVNDESWAEQWVPPPPRKAAEKTLLVAPITDDDDPLPQVKGRSSSVLTILMVLAALFILVAVVWLMLNPPAPTQKKGRSALDAPPGGVAMVDGVFERR